MRKINTILLTLTAGCLALNARAQTDFVTLGKHKAHPTRLLAKYKEGVNVQAPQAKATLNDQSLIVTRTFSQIPGLVIVDSNPRPNVALQGVAQAAKPDPAQQLLTRLVALRDSGLFEYVEPDYMVSSHTVPTDRAFTDGTLWGLRNTGQDGGVPGADIGATNAWDITTGSTNVIVAVIDTGIRYTHEDLRTQMWRNPDDPVNGIDDDNNGYVDDVFGINAITGVGDPFDDESHGTHVSGTIGAASNDGHPHVGVNWAIQLMGCKFISTDGFGFTGDAITCINYAVAKKARVLNNSWGGGAFSQALLDSITAARTNGVLFVASAGNDASNNDANPSYPASYTLDNIISVAALNRFDDLAIFSNFGRTNVDVGAPGVEIYSSIATSDSSYAFFAGTSMAAPHVSGVAALILARFTNAPLTEVRQRILQTAVPIPALRNRSTTGGRVNAFRALNATPDGILEVYPDPPPETDLLAGSNTPFFITVSDLLPVTNATVVGSFPGSTNVTFLNNGTAPDARRLDNIYSATLRVPTNFGPQTLTLSVTAPGKSGGTNTFVYYVFSRPANDNFTNAAKLPNSGAFGNNIILATNRFASIEPGEPLHGGIPSVAASLWWKWSPAQSGSVLADTAGSSFDTVTAVYTGADLRSLTRIASNDDVVVGGVTRLQGNVSFSVTAGLTYFIAISGFDSAETGSIRLRIEPNGQPDTTPPFLTISSPLNGQTFSATNSITVTGTSFDPQPNASGVKEIQVRFNDENSQSADGTTNWSASGLLREGVNTIQAIAEDFAGNISAAETVRITYKPQIPSNDVFANSTLLTNLSGTVPGDTTRATKEAGEPFHAGNEGGRSVWYAWRAPADGVLFLSTENSTFDTLLGLYAGSRVNALTEVSSNDDALDGATFSKLNHAVQSNITYRIAVDGFGGVSGLVQLEYGFVSTNIAEVIVSASAGGTVSPTSGFYPVNSTVVFTAAPDSKSEFVGWAGSITSQENPLSVMIRSNITLTATFRPHQVADDFSSGDFSQLPWTTADVPWFVQNSTTLSNSTSTNVAGGTVVSQIPSTFQPGVPLTITLVATPDPAVTAYFVEDVPPQHWNVADINLDGEFNGNSGKVRWGPFFDNQARTFAYQATPPGDAAAPVYFEGIGIFSGLTNSITGQRQSTLQAARSAVLAHGQQSTLILVTTNGTGIASFDLRVSSEQGWDTLTFYLNNKVVASWSGEVGWLTFEFSVSAGTNRFEWRYAKDSIISVGLDTAYIDNIRLPSSATVAPPPPISTSVPARLSIVRSQVQSGNLHIQGSGQADGIYVMQISGDFIQWTPISTITADANGKFIFVDPGVNSDSVRFYRAVSQ